MLIYACIEYLVKVGANINGRNFLPINRNLKGETACVGHFRFILERLGVFSFHPLVIYRLFILQINK